MAIKDIPVEGHKADCGFDTPENRKILFDVMKEACPRGHFTQPMAQKLFYHSDFQRHVQEVRKFEKMLTDIATHKHNMLKYMIGMTEAILSDEIEEIKERQRERSEEQPF